MGTKKEGFWRMRVAQGREGRGGRTWREGAPTQASPLPSPPSPNLAQPTLTPWSRAFMNWKGAGSRPPPPAASTAPGELEARSGWRDEVGSTRGVTAREGTPPGRKMEAGVEEVDSVPRAPGGQEEGEQRGKEHGELREGRL